MQTEDGGKLRAEAGTRAGADASEKRGEGKRGREVAVGGESKQDAGGAKAKRSRGPVEVELEGKAKGVGTSKTAGRTTRAAEAKEGGTKAEGGTKEQGANEEGAGTSARAGRSAAKPRGRG